MEFREYMHIERYGTDEVQGVELGECYIFPKLDGTNASVWWTPDGLRAGSRKRELSLDEDNAGFYAWVLNGQNNLADFFIGNERNKTLRLYGEWLVPHTFKHYREDAWRRFWIFDVYDDAAGRYLPYPEYQPLLEECGLDYIAPMCILKNAQYDNFLHELDANTFLVNDGKGAGEGIVIKNYDFQNRFRRTVWAKMVRNAFKEKHVVEMGVPTKQLSKLTEQAIVDKYVTKHLVDKTYAKIATENDGWNSKYIPRLLQTVFYDLITEEAWSFIKELKMPTINFKTLNSLTIMSIKKLRPELF